jgi:hypothetical protein
VRAISNNGRILMLYFPKKYHAPFRQTIEISTQGTGIHEKNGPVTLVDKIRKKIQKFFANRQKRS